MLRKMQSFVPKQNGGVHILGYHLVAASTHFPVDISEELFRSQIESLLANCEVISLHSAIEWLEQGHSSDRTKVVLTFDDAYENFYSHVFPLICQWKIPVMLYVPIDFVEGKASAPLQGFESLRPCSWTQLREMLSTGLISIGSHTYSHPDLRQLDFSAAIKEIADSRTRLQDQLGTEVSSFAYPKALTNARIEKLVSASYENAVGRGGIKMQPGSWNRYNLTRIPVLQNTPANVAKVLQYQFWLEERLASWLH